MADNRRSNVRPFAEGKLSKAEKKTAKKQAKSRHTLLRHEGINTSKQPTKHLLVGNGGLINGVSRDDIKSVFTRHGHVTDIVMLPGKPYSVVCYASVQEATRAHDLLQAWVLHLPQGERRAIILYLAFIEEVPGPKMSASRRALPPGLILLDSFIDAEMESELMRSIQWDQEDEAVQQTLKHRRVFHYGYEFNYDTNNIDKTRPLAEPIPGLYVSIIDRIMMTGVVKHRPDQITVNLYQPGQGIPPHIDTHSAFEEEIISLSLGSQVLIMFSNPETNQRIPVYLPRCSLLVMTGEARYLWSHGITPRKSDVIPAHLEASSSMDSPKEGSPTSKTDEDGITLVHRGVRMSLTFRAVREKPCNCSYPRHCDSQLTSVTSDPLPSLPSLPTSDRQAVRLEATHVHEVYENIADHFSSTRHKPWPRVAQFIAELEMGGTMLDVGCGNGKYLDSNSGVYSIGCDRSNQLIKICKDRRFEAFTCDGLRLSIRASSIDACICIAVIHHFSTQARRVAAIQELGRILRPGGLGLIYVWAKEQEREHRKSHYISSTQSKIRAVAKDEIGEEKDEGLKDVADFQDELLSLRQECCEGDEEGVKDEIGECWKHVMIPEDKLVEKLRQQHPQGDDSMDNKCLNGAEKKTEMVRSDVKSPVTADTREEFRNVDLDPKNISAMQDLEIEAVSIRQEASSQEPQISRTLSVHTNRTQFENQDMLIPWHLKAAKHTRTPPPVNGTSRVEDTPVYHRFYHVFQEGELEGLCRMVGGLEIRNSYYDQGNWAVVIKKV